MPMDRGQSKSKITSKTPITSNTNDDFFIGESASNSRCGQSEGSNPSLTAPWSRVLFSGELQRHLQQISVVNVAIVNECSVRAPHEQTRQT
jgi:hypothetical protein